MLPVGIERDDGGVIAQRVESRQERVALATIAREREHASPKLLGDTRGGVPRSVVHHQDFRRGLQGLEAEQHLPQMSGGLVRRDQRRDLAHGHPAGRVSKGCHWASRGFNHRIMQRL